MSRLERYRIVAPFTIDELVEAANGILRNRARQEVTRRTVRYYVSQGIVPPPQGAPKYARYPFGHLVRLVAARCLQDRGLTLDQIRARINRFSPSDEGVAEVSRWLTEPPQVQGPSERDASGEKEPLASLSGEEAQGGASGPPPLPLQPGYRLALTPNAELWIAEGIDLRREIEAVHEALSKILPTLLDM